MISYQHGSKRFHIENVIETNSAQKNANFTPNNLKIITLLIYKILSERSVNIRILKSFETQFCSVNTCMLTFLNSYALFKQFNATFLSQITFITFYDHFTTFPRVACKLKEKEKISPIITTEFYEENCSNQITTYVRYLKFNENVIHAVVLKVIHCIFISILQEVSRYIVRNQQMAQYVSKNKI